MSNPKGHIDAMKRTSTLQHKSIITNKLKESVPTSLDHSRSEVVNNDTIMQTSQIPAASGNLTLDSAVFPDEMTPELSPT